MPDQVRHDGRCFAKVSLKPRVTVVLRGRGRHAKLVRVLERQPCVYILASDRNGTLYVGVTSNLVGRVIQHREGAFGGHTARHRVKRLVWYEMADTMEAAIATEKRLKNWHRQWKVALIERDNEHWADLAIGLGVPPL